LERFIVIYPDCKLIKQEVLKVAVMSSVMLICAFTILGAFVVRMS
jgi:hypothetical protein